MPRLSARRSAEPIGVNPLPGPNTISVQDRSRRPRRGANCTQATSSHTAQNAPRAHHSEDNMLRIATRRASQRFVVRHSSKTAPTPAPVLQRRRRRDNIHWSDIAFKPNNDGWGGGNPQYASEYDRIFGNKSGSSKKAPATAAAACTQPTARRGAAVPSPRHRRASSGRRPRGDGGRVGWRRSN